MAVSRMSIVKFLELAVAVVCLWLHYESETNDYKTDALSITAFGGYIIILIGAFFGHLTSNPINRRIDIFFCLVGCAVFIGAGILNLNYYYEDSLFNRGRRSYGLTKAALAIVNGAVFLVDSLLTWRGDY